MPPRSIFELVRRLTTTELQHVLGLLGVLPDPGTCCVCGCTEQRACPGGCSWAVGRTVCSRCFKEGE